MEGRLRFIKIGKANQNNTTKGVVVEDKNAALWTFRTEILCKTPKHRETNAGRFYKS